ncbi:formyltransferase family protein [Maccoyibacter intestinihominis]
MQKGADLGVTLHKLSEQFDAGDILLQEKIKIEQEDHLVTLLEKIKKFP